MRRRQFIAGLGSAAAWPLVAEAQQGDRVRRIGVFMGGGQNDAEMKLHLSAFTQALAGLGWTDGRNVRMDLRWHGDDPNRIRALAQELVGLQPDIILASGSAITAVQRRAQLLDHLVGAQQNRWRYSKPERLGGLSVQDHLELGRERHRSNPSLQALERTQRP